MYEGDWLNNTAEGNGKYIYADGEYYIGEFKNNERGGFGIQYDSNGNIISQGNWLNDNFIGN